MARLKTTEVKLVQRLLEAPAEDTEELATRILTELAEKRAKDDRQWVAITHWNGIVTTYGPYGTQNQAAKALSKIAAPDETMTGGVRQLRTVE